MSAEQYSRIREELDRDPTRDRVHNARADGPDGAAQTNWETWNLCLTLGRVLRTSEYHYQCTLLSFSRVETRLRL